MKTLFPLERYDAGATIRGRSQYAARLALVLGDGSEWEYRGECYDLQRCTGKCSCGHEGLRYLFRLHYPDGRTVIVGSTCVTTYEAISPALVKRLLADLARLEAAAEERERLAQLAAQSSEIIALMRQWSRAEYATDQAIEAWHAAHPSARWLPPVVFRRPGAAERLADRREVHPFCRLPLLTTVRGQAQRLRKYLLAAAAELAAVQTNSSEAPAVSLFAH